MELRHVNKNRADNRTANVESYIQRNIYVYVDDDTDQPTLDLSDEDYDDAPLEANEESDDDTDESSDYPDTEGAGNIRPIWLLYEGQILWAASRYGFRIAPKEYFRRRVQKLLHFLASKFPGKSYGDLLLSLKGFFAKDNDSSKGNWLESLKNTGILYLDETKKDYEIMPLGDLRAGKGQGKNNELPEMIERLWFEREVSKSGLAPGTSPDWDKFGALLLDSFKNFCEELNDLCGSFDSHEEEDSGKGITSGIGLKKTEFTYEESTLQRKKLDRWKKWWRKK